MYFIFCLCNIPFKFLIIFSIRSNKIVFLTLFGWDYPTMNTKNTTCVHPVYTKFKVGFSVITDGAGQFQLFGATNPPVGKFKFKTATLYRAPQSIIN